MDTQKPGMPSVSPVPAKGERWNWVWPNVDTREGAAWATKQAFGVAVFSACGIAGLGLLGYFGVEFAQKLGFDAWSLVATVIVAVVAYGIRRGSRFAAWAGLVLYSVDRLYSWSTVGIKNPVLAGIFVLAYISGVRGTSALHKLNKAEHSKGESSSSN